MDSFFIVPTILTVVSFTIFCGCFCLCLCFAKKQGRFPTVNRDGPTFGANRSTFGSGVTRNTTAYNEMVNDDPPFGFDTNDFNTTTSSTDNDTTVNTYGWTTTHTIVNEMPPSYSEATGISDGSRHESQNRHCDVGFRSETKDGNSNDGGKCDSGEGGTTYDSGGGGNGGTCDSGGDTGGGDSGGGGGDTATD